MSFCFGIDGYIYYNKSVSRKNDIYKEIVSTEIYHSKLYDEGEKK